MRAHLIRIGLALLVGIVCAAPLHATTDVSIGTPRPSVTPSMLYPAGNLTVSGIVVVNTGSSPITSSFRVGVYLGTPPSWTFLGGQVVTASPASPFFAGAIRTLTIPVVIPNGTRAGVTAITVVADDRNVLTETDETNNAWGGATRVLSGIDLRITAEPTVLSGSTTSPGGSVQLSSFTVTNVGNVTAPATVTGYLFSDCYGGPCVLPVPSQWDGVVTLAPGASYVHPALTVAVPRNENMVGQYYVFVLVDAMDDVSEYLESNNRWFAPVTMVPALIDNQDGTITDMHTHLMWLKNANLAGQPMSWATAVNWAADLVYAGHDDWRLPSGRDPGGSVCNSRLHGWNCYDTEFASLYFNWGIHWNSPGPFQNVQYSNYWTSTAYPDDPTRAMYQDFDDGGQNDYPVSTTCYGWAVRGVGTVSIDEKGAPARSRIVSACPNPARDHSAIAFELASTAAVELAIFDVAGRRVQVWPLGVQAAGRHVVTWKVGASATGPVAPGLYLCRMRTASGCDTKPILILH